jgi:hypothetical protein
MARQASDSPAASKPNNKEGMISPRNISQYPAARTTLIVAHRSNQELKLVQHTTSLLVDNQLLGRSSP